MTSVIDPGVDFWLDYVTAEGGLHERVGDATLVVLPETLQERHRQDAEMTVTADPDVSREDRAVLMTVGHPLLTSAAETVLGEGDVGAVRLPRPTSRTPDLAQLQDWARDRLTVDHGRVDLTGGPRPGVRYLLRVSSLVTFAMSSDDRFQERIECWVDVPSGLPLPDGPDRVLADLLEVEHPEREHLDPKIPGLSRALVAVDAEIGRRAELRRQTLGDGVRTACHAELDRTRDYYEQMAQSLRQRMSTASPEKAAGYRDRLDHCLAERDRRLAEVEDKYRSSVQCLPYRLHLVGVPSLCVEAGVRRGNRWYPVDLEWLSPIRRFAPVACSGCGSGEMLVAGKDGLGCRRCRPPRLLEPVPEPAPTRPDRPPKAAKPPGQTPAPLRTGTTEAAGESAERPAEPTGRRAAAVLPTGRRPVSERVPDRPGPTGRPARPASRGSKRIEPSWAAMTRAGSKLIQRLWERVEGDDRSVARMCAADGPAAALVRVFGPAGPRVALGLPDGLRLLSVASSPSEPVPGTDLWLTIGCVCASDRMDHPFQVVWHMVNGRPLIDEVAGVATGLWPWLPPPVVPSRPDPGLWEIEPTPQQAKATFGDPVARLVLDTTVPVRGIAVAARCLAAWWRLDPSVAAELVANTGPLVVTAALDKQVSMRASTARRSDLELAADYGVDPAAVKSTATRLQRRLAMSATRPW